MKRFLELLFRTTWENWDPKSNLLQVVVYTPIFIALSVFWRWWGIEAFAIGVAIVTVLTIAGWLYVHHGDVRK